MLANDMKEALKNLEDAEHALTVQKDWMRRAEKRVRECQAVVAALVKPHALPVTR
jgi:pyridoxine/pyridoxamine 5'-phosphate oxidase